MKNKYLLHVCCMFAKKRLKERLCKVNFYTSYSHSYLE